MINYNKLHEAKLALKEFKEADINMFELEECSVILFDESKNKWVISINLKRYRRNTIQTKSLYIPFVFKEVPLVICF